MNNTNYLNCEINGNNFVSFFKKLTKFAVIALLISTGFINETNGMKKSPSPEIRSQQQPLLNITTKCFDIQNKEVCGNVLLYRTELRIDNYHCPIALQSGLGSATARLLAEATKNETAVSPLVLSGLDVVLAVGTCHLKISDGGDFYESTYDDVELQNAVKTLEMGNWNPSNQAITTILNSLYAYGNLLENINWGQQNSAISDQTNKDNWLQILGHLKSNPAHVSNVLKNLIPAMARGMGIQKKDPAILKGLVEQLEKVVVMKRESIRKALLWGRYALHTEPQVEALSAVGNNINVVSWTLNTQTNTHISRNLELKTIQLMGDCYSLYNPCRSCQGLNWVISCQGSTDKRFLFCLGDNSSSIGGKDLTENFTPY